MKTELENYINKLKIWAAERCRVCGGPMRIASSERKGVKYACLGASEKVTKYKWGTKEERENSKHYHDSSTWDRKEMGCSIFSSIAKDLLEILQSSEGTANK